MSFPGGNNNNQNNQNDQWEQNAYGDLILKVQNKEKLSEEERLMFCHDYIQRYGNRILTEEEYDVYKKNKFMGQVAGIGLSVCIPMSTALYFQSKYHP